MFLVAIDKICCYWWNMLLLIKNVAETARARVSFLIALMALVANTAHVRQIDQIHHDLDRRYPNPAVLSCVVQIKHRNMSDNRWCRLHGSHSAAWPVDRLYRSIIYLPCMAEHGRCTWCSGKRFVPNFDAIWRAVGMNAEPSARKKMHCWKEDAKGSSTNPPQRVKPPASWAGK